MQQSITTNKIASAINFKMSRDTSSTFQDSREYYRHNYAYKAHLNARLIHVYHKALVNSISVVLKNIKSTTQK